ncbi:MAG: flagellar basal body L-ring protein FlgH [Bdellovibrionia bacterium]
MFNTGCAQFVNSLKQADEQERERDFSESAFMRDERAGKQNAQNGPRAGALRKGSRVRREDFIDQSQEEGSLWASSGQTNYYFTRNKIRAPGDLFTVKIENELLRNIQAEIKGSLSDDERDEELSQARSKLRDQLSKSTEGSKKDNAGDSKSPEASSDSEKSDSAGASDVDRQLSQLNFKDLDISSSLELKVGDGMMAEVLGRFSNGNYKIQATKRVLMKKGYSREVRVVALVKEADLAQDSDSLDSGKLYDTQVAVAR